MEYKTTLRLQKCLYFNFYGYIVWFGVTGILLYLKVDKLGHLTKYLAVTVFSLLVVIEAVKLHLGNYGNLSNRVPELAGFLMVAVLMEMPLISFFVFNPYLMSTPTEIILHAMLWIMTGIEIVLCFFALKQASLYAKNIYLCQRKNK